MTITEDSSNARASADLPSLLNNGISPNKSPDSINATKDSLPSNERFL